MAKKIKYADLFTLRKDGRYQGSYTDETGRHYVYDRDPERLWHKLNDPKEEKVLLFRDIAEAWQKDAWEKIQDGTKSCYNAPYKRAVDRFGDRPVSDIEPHDIATHLQMLKSQGFSASTIKSIKSCISRSFNSQSWIKFLASRSDTIRYPTLNCRMGCQSQNREKPRKTRS